MTIDSAVFDIALAMLRATAGAISIAIAVVNFPQAMLITPHREWALVAVMVLGLGGLLMVLGLGGPIGPGLVAETLLVVVIVSSVAPGFWDVSGRLGYFPALRAMSNLTLGWIAIPEAVAAAIVAIIGNGTWSLDRVLDFSMPNSVRTVWFACVAVSGLLVPVVRALQAPK